MHAPLVMVMLVLVVVVVMVEELVRGWLVGLVAPLLALCCIPCRTC